MGARPTATATTTSSTRSRPAADGRGTGSPGPRQEVLLDASTTDVTFTVRATNKAGQGEASPASAPQRFFQKPGPVSNLDAQETGANNTVRITFGAAAGNGASPSEITYRWRVGGTSGTLPAGGGTVTNPAFPNGTNVSVEVWATSTVRGESAVGDARSDAANAYGPPNAPTVSAGGTYQAVNYNWSAQQSNNNGRDLQSIRVQVTGRGDQNGVYVGNGSQATSPSGTVTITVTVTNTAGQSTSTSTSAQAWAGATEQWARGSAATGCTFSGSCYYIQLRLERWRPNSIVSCYIPGLNAQSSTAQIRVDGSGNWGWGDVPNARVGTLNNYSDMGDCTQT